MVGGAGAFFAVAAKQAISYQNALTKVSQTTNASAAQTKALGDAVSTLAIGGVNNAATLLNALAPVAGELQALTGGTLTAADATKVLTAAENLQGGAQANLNTSTKNLIDLLKVYHQNASEAASISDSLFQAHAQLGMGVDQLAMMLTRLQPRIVGSGLSLKQLLGFVAEATKVVGSGPRAMMQVGAMIQGLMNPAHKLAGIFKTLGINLLDSKGHFIGVTAEIQKLHDAFLQIRDPATRAALAQAIFGRNAKIGMSFIQGGTQAIRDNMAALAAHGTAAAAAAKDAATFTTQMEILQKDLEAVALAVGQVIMPAFVAIANALVPIFDSMAKFAQQNPQVVAAFVAIAGAIGAVLAGLTLLGPAFGHLSGLIGGLLGTLGVGGGILGLLLFGGLGAAAAAGIFGDQAQKTVTGFATQVIGFVQDQAPRVAAAVSGWIQGMVNWIGSTGIPMFLHALTVLWNSITAWVGDGSRVRDLAKQLATWTLAFLGWAADTGAKVLGALAIAINAALPELSLIGQNIINGIGEAILKDPATFVKVIGAFFALAVVVQAIGAAGTALGVVWKLAFQLAAIAAGEFATALAGMLGLGSAAADAAAAGGAVEGGAFSTSFAGAVAAKLPALLKGILAGAGGAMIGGLNVHSSDEVMRRMGIDPNKVDQDPWAPVQMGKPVDDGGAQKQLANQRKDATMVAAAWTQAYQKVTAASQLAGAKQVLGALKTAQAHVKADQVALKSATGTAAATIKAQLVADQAKVKSAASAAHAQVMAAMTAAHQEEAIWASAYTRLRGTFFGPMIKAAWDVAQQNVAAADQAYGAWVAVAGAQAGLHTHGRPHIPGITRVGSAHPYGTGGGAKPTSLSGGGTPSWMKDLMKELGMMPAKIGHHVGKHVAHHVKKAVCPPTGSLIVDQHGNPIHKKVEILTPGHKPKHILALERALAPGAAGSAPITGSQSGASLQKAIHFRPTIHIHVYLDGKKIHHATSRHLFHEERRHAGAASASSRF